MQLRCAEMFSPRTWRALLTGMAGEIGVRELFAHQAHTFNSGRMPAVTH
jgi:hypothetical protein